ncbi:11382_t:CDS:2 [Dentiscutata erythropus]|uniref:11382_t:CDS:1 n=1 Tax=Dentiscutata erythropus TaxID=1348616 RepID=A0A9N9IF09_9GLOM|nr:11382_t:CDS:2 [Dentiscutata erythropus]
MTNVYTLKDINNKSDGSFRGAGQRLGGEYEQELKEKLYSALRSKAELRDLNEKLVDKYSEREKEYQQIYADIGNKIDQVNESTTKSHSESQRELEAEIKSLKSSIKTLKREATLAQKASSLDKATILSLETKVGELEAKLENKELDQVSYDSLRLELERVKEDLNSKEYTIECIEKGIEATHRITSQGIDTLSSARLNLIKEISHLREIISKKDNEIADLSNPSPPSMNDSSQLDPEGTLSTLNPSSQIIPVGGAEVVPSPQVMPLIPAIPVVASSLMIPMIAYSILILFLIAVIWFVFGKKIWDSWKKSDRYIQTNELHLRAYPRPGCMIGVRKRASRDQI